VAGRLWAGAVPNVPLFYPFSANYKNDQGQGKLNIYKSDN
jgi:hypothetical protein